MSPLFFFPFFVVFYLAIVFAVSRIGDWGALSEHYRLTEAFIGQRWRFRSGSLGLANYNNCLVVGCNPRGLYLSIWFPFRLGHPPLFIPWPEITSAPPIKHWFVTMVEFRFRSVPSVKLSLPVALVKELADSSGGQFKISEAT